MSKAHRQIATGREAFCALVRALYAARPMSEDSCYLPEAITSWRWFHAPKLSYYQETEADQKIALEAMNLLRDGVRAGKVWVSGILNSEDESVSIGPEDFKRSSFLDIFADKLDCTVKAPRIYRGLVLSLDDVLALAPTPVAPSPRPRLSPAELQTRVREYFDQRGREATQKEFIETLEATGRKYDRVAARAEYKAAADAHHVPVARGRRSRDANLPN